MSKPYPIKDVVRFRYPLTIIKKIELINDDKGQCVEEVVTLVNKHQISGRSFLEDKTQPQIPTLNRVSASVNWDNNSDNQSSNQQWLTGNSYWTITPINPVLVGADIPPEAERSSGMKRAFTAGYSNRQIAHSENTLNTQLELSCKRD